MSDEPVALYECTTVECPEAEIMKPAFADWGDVVVLCGECWQPCTKHAAGGGE